MVRIDKNINGGKTKLGKIWFRFKEMWSCDIVAHNGYTINNIFDLYNSIPLCKSAFELATSERFYTVDFSYLHNTVRAYCDDDESLDDDLRKLLIADAVLEDVKMWGKKREEHYPIRFLIRNEETMFKNAVLRIVRDQEHLIQSLKDKGYSLEDIRRFF